MADQDTDKKTETWTLFGSVGAALGAAVCCLGPVVLVSFGVSGAWIGQLSALEPYRPLFMVVAAGFLGVGFYRTYGGARGGDDSETCQEDCEVPKASRINRATLWIATVVVAGLFASPYLLAVENSEAFSTSQATARAPSGEESSRTGSASESEPALRRVELKVEGMTCGGCVRTVTTTLEKQKGVEKADVMLKPPRATVEYDPSRTDPTRISKATDEVGYPSSVIE
ncbi:MAG: mercuric transporter MerT family protein [Bradymonadaceae bacterium]